jgi:enamine deaminase RidA (YjgF/YER057c/UK114 family)
MTTPLEKLRELGYELPKPSPPVATSVPVTRTGNIIYISGQISRDDNGVVSGRLGDTLNVVQGGNAAELAALGVLAQIVYGAGIELTAVKRVLKLTVFVCSTPEFAEHHLVANGASNLIVHVLGDVGKHARSAIGMAALPLGAAVEVEAIVEVVG